MRNKTARMLLALLAFAYAVMWAGGVGSHIFYGGPPGDMRWAAPAFLLLAGLITVCGSNAEEIGWLVAAAIIGLASEVVGVRYGFLYGDYVYTDALGPALFGVPVVMAGAWMALVAYVRSILLPLRLSFLSGATLASLWMTAIDLVIDPLAAGPLGYWRWLEAGKYYDIPARNFLGWFIVSLTIFSLMRPLTDNRHAINRAARAVGLSIVVFFTVIALTLGFYLAGVIGVMLCVIDQAVAYLPARKRAVETGGR